MRYLLLVLLLVASDAFAAPAPDSVPPLPPGVPVLPVSVASSMPSAAALPARPAPLSALPRVHGQSVDLRFVPVAQVVDLIYADLLDEPYVLDPAVLADTRPVSFRFDRSQGDIRTFLKDFLASLGYTVTLRDGVAYVSKSDESVQDADRQTFVYVPRYRSADYLSRIVQPMVQGRFTENRSVAAPAGAKGASAVPATSAAGLIDQSTDALVFIGSAHDVAMLKQVLPQIDTPVGEVLVRAWAYEVDDTGATNSGFSIASHLLGVGLSVSSGSTSADANAMQFDAGRLDFAISAMNSDSRFHEMSSPDVRCVSGQQVKLNVGQQVPTISSISYQGTSGTPVQSVAYQDAGVIFDVTPTVMRDVIELNVDEEISSFVNTTTGVNGSPTKNTRSLQTVADLKNGQVIVLGGLIQDNDSDARSHERFLPRFLDGRSSNRSRTEVVLILQVQKV